MNPTIDTTGMVKAQEAIEAEWPDCTVSIGTTMWCIGEAKRRHVDYHACVQTDYGTIAYAHGEKPGELLATLRTDAATRKARADEEAAHTAEQAQSEP